MKNTQVCAGTGMIVPAPKGYTTKVGVRIGTRCPECNTEQAANIMRNKVMCFEAHDRN